MVKVTNGVRSLVGTQYLFISYFKGLVMDERLIQSRAGHNVKLLIRQVAQMHVVKGDGKPYIPTEAVHLIQLLIGSALHNQLTAGRERHPFAVVYILLPIWQRQGSEIEAVIGGRAIVLIADSAHQDIYF